MEFAYALVFFPESKTKSVLRVKELKPDVEVGKITTIQYGNESFEVEVLFKSGKMLLKNAIIFMKLNTDKILLNQYLIMKKLINNILGY